MTVLTNTITAEELFAMGDIGRCELIEGEIVPMPPAGEAHGDIAGELFGRIWLHLKGHKLGKAYAAETGFIISRNPDTVRAPDVAVVRADRVPDQPSPGFFDGAPDLAIEVVSPGDSASEVTAKVDQWLAAGVTSVWVVDPPNRTIDIHRGPHEIHRHRPGDQITHEPVLPGFVLKVDELFR